MVKTSRVIVGIFAAVALLMTIGVFFTTPDLTSGDRLMAGVVIVVAALMLAAVTIQEYRRLERA